MDIGEALEMMASTGPSSQGACRVRSAYRFRAAIQGFSAGVSCCTEGRRAGRRPSPHAEPVAPENMEGGGRSRVRRPGRGRRRSNRPRRSWSKRKRLMSMPPNAISSSADTGPGTRRSSLPPHASRAPERPGAAGPGTTVFTARRRRRRSSRSRPSSQSAPPSGSTLPPSSVVAVPRRSPFSMTA